MDYLQVDAWLGEQLGRDAYKVSSDGLLDASLDSLRGELDSLRQDYAFAYLKIPCDQDSQIHHAESLGFRLADTAITLHKYIQGSMSLSGQSTLRFARAEDREGAVAVAAKSFVYDRFHRDAKVDNQLADNLKAGWVDNFFNGKRGDEMVIAEIDGQVVGFNQLLYRDTTLIIDLIATHPDYRRRQIGQDLIAFAAMRCQGFSEYKVSTQVRNIPSLRLYEKMGFRIDQAVYVFHWHSR